jgi:capsular polysaccharide biosynthesis protein
MSATLNSLETPHPSHEDGACLNAAAVRESKGMTMSTQKDDSPPPLQPATRQNSGGWLVLLLVLPLICGGIGFLAGAVIAYVSPKKYESRALVQVSQERISVDSRGLPELASQQGASFQFLATEVAVITSRATLERVVERLDLAARWNLPPDQVVDLLSSLVTVERIPDTDLLTIRVRHTNAQDARDLAEAVAEAYADRRTERETDRAEQALQALDEELRKQEDVVEEKRKVLDIIVQGGGFPYVRGGAGAGAAASRERIYELAEVNYFELEKEKQQLGIQLGGVAKWSGEDPHKTRHDP